MRARVCWMSGAAVGVFLAGLIGCASLWDSSEDELLENPSFHILVSEEQAVPETGTYLFDTGLFKIDYSDEIELADIDRRVTSSIEAELEPKGLRRVAEDPDLLVSYAVAIDSPITGSDFNEAYADDFPIEFPEPGPGQGLRYHQGTLIVDFVDRRSQKLLWRGAIMAGVDMDVSESVKERRTRQAVQILLAHFPRPISAE